MPVAGRDSGCGWGERKWDRTWNGIGGKYPPEETVSEEAAPEEPEEAVSGEALPGEPEEAAGEVEPVSGNFKYKVSENGSEVIITGHKDGTDATGDLVIPDSINGLPVTLNWKKAHSIG